jgi:hypothetical protein
MSISPVLVFVLLCYAAFILYRIEPGADLSLFSSHNRLFEGKNRNNFSPLQDSFVRTRKKIDLVWFQIIFFVHVSYVEGRVMAQAVSRLSPRRPGFAPRSIQWDLWWTKWHWDRFFSEFFGFPQSISFHSGLHFSENSKKYFIHPLTHPHPGMDKRPVKAAAVQ